MEANKALAHRFCDEWNRGNMEGLYTIFADDIINHSAFPGQRQGLEGMRQGLGALRLAFPDLQLTLDVIVAEGDLVAEWGHGRGTNTGSYMGRPPTGKQVTFTVADLHRYANGKMIETWSLLDSAALMQQLGLAPTQRG